jgi:hypothetical protein
MKYENARNLIFGYYLKEKKLNYLTNEINRFKRNIPHDNGAASAFIIEQMDKIILEKELLEKEMSEMKEEIETLLRVFT